MKVLFAVTLLLPMKVRLFIGAFDSACVIVTVLAVAFIKDVDQFPLVLEELVVRVLFQVKLPAA